MQNKTLLSGLLVVLSVHTTRPEVIQNEIHRSLATGANEALLSPCNIEGIPTAVECGTMMVWENRLTKSGRKIPINVIRLPARNPSNNADPVFSLYGGPGQAATDGVNNEWEAWYRDNRAVVLVGRLW